MDGFRIQLYTIFHLNLAYSSIEEEQRPEVVEKCYWPLLKLARKYNLPFGIEATAYTLESISEIDPSWIDELLHMTAKGPCEFIGSGYSQLIGPIVPAEINIANLRIGNEIYSKVLGSPPGIAFINEQAYSSGLVKHYIDAGYKAIIMEWENPYQSHKEWESEWKYLPQFACDQHGNIIPVIWNMSIAFQKFQRYAHGEMDLSEYIRYLQKHVSDSERLFPMYGNDVEIFNFRPVRYRTEAELDHDEWERIDCLFNNLCNESWLQFIPPSGCLHYISNINAGKKLHLESAQQPIVTKKQGKYNISRWAVTGRNDLGINSLCWRIYSYLHDNEISDDDEWRELCYLWSSDFRTHITQKRWNLFQERLNCMLEKYNLDGTEKFSKSNNIISSFGKNRTDTKNKDRYLICETDDLKIVFNKKRGLAIESLEFKRISDKPLVCSLPHGYYADVLYGADFYSGHFTFESTGNPKITDLNPVIPILEEDKDLFSIRSEIQTPLGSVRKKYEVSRDRPEVALTYQFLWDSLPLGSLRLGHILLNPEAFQKDSLFYSTSNGGLPETFFVQNRDFDHGTPVSFLVSTSLGFGTTQNRITMGDDQKILIMKIDNTFSAPLALIKFQTINDSYFYRLAFSLREMDETSREIKDCIRNGYGLRFSIGITK